VRAQHVAVLLEGALRAEADALHAGEHVAGLDPGLVGDRASRDGADPDADTGAVLGDHADAVDAEAEHVLARDERVEHGEHLIAVDGPAVVVLVVVGVVHAEHTAFAVDERAARVARPDARIVLDDRVDVRPRVVAVR
jgi:hypothetical protein